MGSKGSQTTTSTNAPNAAALNSYYDLLTRAGQTAGQPYTPFSGELVAPVNQQQQTGIGNINQYATSAIPGLQTAQNLFQQSAQPLTQAQIEQYYNPYQRDVVGAAEAQFNQQDAIQQNQLLASQASQGALGGTGTNVAQALLAGQQQLQQAPVIAGLEQQGYTQALQEAGQEYQQNPQAAAFGLGSAATALENAGLTGANAQVGAGSLEQTTQQALDQALYQQYLNEQAYPFQTTQWLAGIDTGVGSQMGGTSQTTQPPPSMLGQIMGGVAGGAGILGGTGAFGSAGWLSGLGSSVASGLGSVGSSMASMLPMMLVKDGGRIEGRAQGGVVPHLAVGGTPSYYPQFGGGYGVATMPYAAGRGFVPGIGITRGHTIPGAPRPFEDNSSQQMWQNAAKLAGNFKGMGGSGVGPIGTSPEVAQVANVPMGTPASDQAIYARGGKVVPLRKSGGGLPRRAGLGLASFVPRFADGGANDNQTVVPEQEAPAAVVNSRWFAPPVPAELYGTDPTANILKFQAYGQSIAPQGGIGPAEAFAPTDGASLPQAAPAMPSAGVAPPDGGLSPQASLAPSVGQQAPLYAPPAGVAPPASQPDRWGAGADIWPTLIAAGAGMLASRSPFPGVAVGQGLQAGLGEMGALQQAHLAQAKEAREEKTAQQDIDLKVRQLNQSAKAEQDRLAQEAKQLAETARYHTGELAKPFAVGTDPATGMPVYAVRDPNAPNGVRRVDLTGDMAPVAPPANTQTPSAQTGLPGTQTAPAENVPPKVLDTPVGVHPDVLAGVNAQLAAQVKALDEGRMQFPSGFALKTPYWQNMLRLVSQYDPSFDAVNYNARARARQDFTSGKSAQNITSFNTAIGHLGTLDNSIDALGNTRFGWLNPVLQAGKAAVGDTEFQKAQKDFMTAKQAVTDELTRAFRGSGGNVHDIVGWERTLNQADSPVALHEAVRGAVNLLRSRIEAIGDQYNRGMGTTRDPLTLLSPHAQQTIEKLEGRTQSAGGANGQASASAPPVAGAKFYQGRWYTRGPNGEAVPVQ